MFCIRRFIFISPSSDLLWISVRRVISGRVKSKICGFLSMWTLFVCMCCVLYLMKMRPSHLSTNDLRIDWSILIEARIIHKNKWEQFDTVGWILVMTFPYHWYTMSELHLQIFFFKFLILAHYKIGKHTPGGLITGSSQIHRLVGLAYKVTHTVVSAVYF